MTTAVTQDRRTRTIYRRLMMLGFDPGEAGNLTAYISGIAISDQPWTLKEVNNLLFLQQMRGALWSGPDDRPTSDPTGLPTPTGSAGRGNDAAPVTSDGGRSASPGWPFIGRANPARSS